MTDLMRYAAELTAAGASGGAPVERWNPPYCGEIDLVIRADGLWVHEGSPIGRAPLVRLFASVLKREGDRYFLVTPVEKLGIQVEDAPFLAVLVRAEGEGSARRLVFTTNVGEEIVASSTHPLDYRPTPAGDRAPYLLVRRGLEARVARAAFYDLVEYGETRHLDGATMFGVASDGAFFAFGDAATVFGEANG